MGWIACISRAGYADSAPCGFRTISWGPSGFFVNGEEVKLRGACIHHDNGVLGACAFADAEFRRVRILKEAGFNAIRSSHNQASTALVEACDRLGMYLMDEAFDQWVIHKNPYDYADETFRVWWQRDLAVMIEHDLSHPSVVMYSIGNEISELGLPEGREFCGQLADLVREADPTRPVTSGVNIMLALMAASGNGMYSNNGEAGPSADTASEVPTSVAYNALMNRIGVLMWTGWDYLGESGIGTIQYEPEKQAGSLIATGGAGVIDICGKKRSEVEWNRAIWGLSDGPAIGVETLTRAGQKRSASMWRDTNAVASWSWEGYEGGMGEVIVYARAKWVELLLNGRSLGRRHAPRRRQRQPL